VPAKEVTSALATGPKAPILPGSARANQQFLFARAALPIKPTAGTKKALSTRRKASSMAGVEMTPKPSNNNGSDKNKQAKMRRCLAFSSKLETVVSLKLLLFLMRILMVIFVIYKWPHNPFDNPRLREQQAITHDQAAGTTTQNLQKIPTVQLVVHLEDSFLA